jgi:hypothetical protein
MTVKYSELVNKLYTHKLISFEGKDDNAFTMGGMKMR